MENIENLEILTSKIFENFEIVENLQSPKFPGLRATEIANSKGFVEKNKFEDRFFERVKS